MPTKPHSNYLIVGIAVFVLILLPAVLSVPPRSSRFLFHLF